MPLNKILESTSNIPFYSERELSPASQFYGWLMINDERFVGGTQYPPA